MNKHKLIGAIAAIGLTAGFVMGRASTSELDQSAVSAGIAVLNACEETIEKALDAPRSPLIAYEYVPLSIREGATARIAGALIATSNSLDEDTLANIAWSLMSECRPDYKSTFPIATLPDQMQFVDPERAKKFGYSAMYVDLEADELVVRYRLDEAILIPSEHSDQ